MTLNELTKYLDNKQYGDFEILCFFNDQLFLTDKDNKEVVCYNTSNKTFKIMFLKDDNKTVFKPKKEVKLEQTIQAYPTATRAINNDRVTAEYLKNTTVYIWKIHENGAINISTSIDKAGGWVNPICLQNSI